MVLIAQLVRGVTIAALLLSSVIALTFWLVRAGHLGAFSAWARAVRRVANPILRPIELRLVRAGRNPQDAPLWLFGFSVLGGLLLISLTDWLIVAAIRARYAAAAGTGGVAAFVVTLVFGVLILAIILRVIGSWFGIGPYRPWFRPVYILTDWLIEPIRRVLPPMGMIDFSPLVAWLLLVVMRSFLLGLLR